MEWIETTGASVNEAKDAALDLLGVAADEAVFEVVEEERIGLLGRLKSPARVRARVRPKQVRERDDRRNQRRRRDRGAAKTASSGAGKGDNRTQDGRNQDGRGRASTSGGQAKKAAANSGERAKDGAGQKRAPKPAPENALTPNDEPTVSVSMDELVPSGVALLEGLLERFGMPATVTASTSPDRLDFNIDGDDLGVLIGPGGRMVDGIQEITRAVLLKSARGGADFRIGVDVGGYRDFRREALASFGADVARSAIESGRAVALDPMGSIDRKIVHDAVQSVDGVTSSSEGFGEGRRVVVTPAAE